MVGLLGMLLGMLLCSGMFCSRSIVLLFRLSWVVILCVVVFGRVFWLSRVVVMKVRVRLVLLVRFC